MEAKKSQARPGRSSVARWEQGEDGEWLAATHPVEVAYVDGRPVSVPSVCTVAIGSDSLDGGKPQRYHLSVEVGVRAGEVTFRKVSFLIYDEMTASELAKIPWRRVADLALAANARDVDPTETFRALERSRGAGRARERRRDAGLADHRGARRDDERLAEVLELADEAKRLNMRQDEYVGLRLSLPASRQGVPYSADYVRRLISKARRAAR
jgi:hypothetical protein